MLYPELEPVTWEWQKIKSVRDSRRVRDIFQCCEYHTRDKEGREEDNEELKIWSKFQVLKV